MSDNLGVCWEFCGGLAEFRGYGRGLLDGGVDVQCRGVGAGVAQDRLGVGLIELVVDDGGDVVAELVGGPVWQCRPAGDEGAAAPRWPVGVALAGLPDGVVVAGRLVVLARGTGAL